MLTDSLLAPYRKREVHPLLDMQPQPFVDHQKVDNLQITIILQNGQPKCITNFQQKLLTFKTTSHVWPVDSIH